MLASRRFEPVPHRRRVGVLSAVLFVHGWEGAQDTNDVNLAGLLAAAGLRCLTFDLAGHGLSAGNRSDYSLADFVEQAVAAFDSMSAGKPAADAVVGICGTSLGAYLAMQVSALRPVQALSLRVPANYPDKLLAGGALGSWITGSEPAGWRRLPLSAHDNRAVAALENFHGPVQIIAAGEDETIPYQGVKNFVDVVNISALDYHLIPDSTHVIYERSGPREVALRMQRDWLLSLRDA